MNLLKDILTPNRQPRRPKIGFTSKADVLEALSAWPDLHIPPPCAFTCKDWQADRQSVLDRIRAKLENAAPVAVRSSCRKEDSEESSGAGAFLSVLNVDAASDAALAGAIDRVIASYGEALPEDQVLVQPMIKNPQVTGVIMTRALADGSPYYVINYDDESGTTDSVTGGSRVSKTVYVYRGARDTDFDSPRLKSFVALARRVEEISGKSALDLEFCLDGQNILHLLQARPISVQKNWPENKAQVHDFIDHIARFVDERTRPAAGMFGQSSILGVMPDWNPAEMIGILPSPLASSLYRNLITQNVWSQARKAMGYREMPSAELMLLVMGRPYIDVRASFNSFLPAGLDAVTSEVLVSAWLDRLEKYPQLHDKVEFEVAQTAMDFCFDSDLEERYPGLLTSSRKSAFRERLLDLTRKNLDLSPHGSLRQAMEAVIELRNRQAGRPLACRDAPPPISALNRLLAECRQYGTLPFSILARHAFIAESLLRAAVKREALGKERLAAFKFSIQTISGTMAREFAEVCQGRCDAKSFLQKYGHLRPGSYDILSPRYVDRTNLFYDNADLEARARPPFRLEPQESASLDALLAGHGFALKAEDLLVYARQAIAGRELAKFIFTRNLSDALETVAYWGETLGFAREDMAFADVAAILDHNMRVLPESPKAWFGRHIALNREMSQKAGLLKLGYLIRSMRDVYIAPQHRAAPNFVGSSQIVADAAPLASGSACDVDISGKIVCIENADPGFDWIFTRGIGGLVTKFGGANSHMAIRCAEYGLPAAIGVGSQIFEEVSGAARICLNPAASSIKASRAIGA